MRCSKCGAENREGARFCDKCGATLSLKCPSCGAENRPDAKFCDSCGAALSGSLSTKDAKPEQPPRTAIETERLEGERRHLSVVFCDLVGSTELSHHLDPEESRAIVLPYQRKAAQVVEQFGGHVAKFLGDGVMAIFGWPQAHEDDAERAVRAALAILEAIAALNRESQGPKLSARIGIHTGEAVVAAGGDAAPDVFGDASNLASRVQSAADTNTVVISAQTHQLVAGRFVIESLGNKDLKGIDEPVELFRVIRPSGARGHLASAAVRGLTPFVGREDELRTLLNRWERARQGEGQVVLISGEAGIGKSRLVRQFHELIAGTPHLWIKCELSPYLQNTPLAPVADMIQQALGWRGDDSVEAKLAQLEQNLERVALQPAEALPLLAPLLNLPVPEKYSPLTLTPEQQRKRLLATLTGWLLGISRMQPLVMVLEDVQWSDPSTLEFHQSSIEQGATVPLLLLYTTRPEFRAPWPMLAHHTQITLGRLRDRDVRDMVHAVAAHTALTEQMVDAVTSRSSGVPLFVEELTRSVVESSRQGTVDIPETLHNSLIARLDRLGAAKEVAQIASVLGREFTYPLLRAIVPMSEDELQSALARLIDAELIYARGVPPEASYVFKHALIRDAAYDTLFRSKRKELHRRVAATIADKFPATVETEPEVLARHWTLASETTAAIASWRKAGDLAISHRAYVEAREPYQQALAMLSTLPDSPERDAQEIYLISALADVLSLVKGYTAPEFADATRHARILAEKTGNLVQLVHRLHGTWTNVQVAGNYAAAAALADQVLDLAERERGGASLGLAYQAQIATRYWRGDLLGVEEYFARGKAFLDDPGLRLVPGTPSLALGYSSLNVWTMGMAVHARERIKKAMTAAHANSDPYELAVVQHMAAQLYLCLREPSLAETFAKQSLALSDEHGFTLYKCFSPICLGRAYQHLGREAEGIALIRQGLEMMVELGARRGICRYLTYLAEAQAVGGMVSAALETVEEAIRANPQELAHRPETLRVRGDLHLRNGEGQSAESDYLDSISLAKKMSAKMWELRAVTSLARLLRDTNRRHEARSMLYGIYNWFTEGFDTADLKDAKALLDELDRIRLASS